MRTIVLALLLVGCTTGTTTPPAASAAIFSPVEIEETISKAGPASDAIVLIADFPKSGFTNVQFWGTQFHLLVNVPDSGGVIFEQGSVACTHWQGQTRWNDSKTIAVDATCGASRLQAQIGLEP